LPFNRDWETSVSTALGSPTLFADSSIKPVVITQGLF
jgi:hypothetical protein